ncbi:Ni,Fe-hydrogenase III large subunit [Variovorax sp. YR216]|uniref:hydrogenase large subunit n=1 Tax=Variovorax sp. YR216 TaxID=1882828 RepID=UPI00089CF873|nr:Ni,Fe-hydrogenase III large subunit [Variovorax sp. YR216]SEB26431.1 Ni,Fe-hydrogenase III large subunit [Variovorax sp. YR216]
MPITRLGLMNLTRLGAPVAIWHAPVDRAAWSATAGKVAAAGGRLVALWATHRDETAGSSASVSAALAGDFGLLWMELSLDVGESFPDLTPSFACASRMQRAVADLNGLQAEGARDRRPWLDHGLWRDGPPLAPDASPIGADARTLPADYPFVRVEGDGVHEIPVGPVHAGIIEPGHFRFSVVGEKVLRLEERLGYVHKGIERRFTALPALEGHRLAGRVSGDSTVAFAWAYCMALESATGIEVPERAAWLRALLLERERVANHLGDLGALGNDAALAFGLAQFSRLREDWQRLSKELFSHRFMMDAIVPGGVAVDPGTPAADRVRAQCDAIEREVRTLRGIYDEHAGLQVRFMTTGRVSRELALRLGLTGLAARASGVAQDLRVDQSFDPYRRFDPQLCLQTGGDVAARAAVRFDEIFESLRLIRRICEGLPAGPVARDVSLPVHDGARGVGWVEGWRGEVMVALELGSGGGVNRCHPHDPSWQNWPVLEHAVIGNIVPDFPLINKSFNLSYSGHDL